MMISYYYWRTKDKHRTVLENSYKVTIVTILYVKYILIGKEVFASKINFNLSLEGNV